MSFTATTDSNTRIDRNTKALIPWLFVAAGLCCMYIPTFIDTFRGVWSSDTHAHGPIVFALSLWLLYRKWPDMLAARTEQKNSVAIILNNLGVRPRIIAILLRGMSGWRKNLRHGLFDAQG